MVIDILLVVLLTALCFGSLFLVLLQLPGTWLILLFSTAYSWYYGWERIEWWLLVVVAVLAVVAEVVEAVASVWFARRGGASSKSSWWGFGGGMAGALLLSIPVPLFGTLVGAAVGCFAGTFLAELYQQKKTSEGARAGAFAALGRTVGSVFKLMAAMAMTSGVVFAAVRSLF